MGAGDEMDEGHLGGIALRVEHAFAEEGAVQPDPVETADEPALDRTSLVLTVAALPPLLAGGWLGWLAFGRLDECRFRQVLALMIAVSGAMLVL